MASKNTLRITIRKQVFNQLVDEFGDKFGFIPENTAESGEFVSTVLSYVLMEQRRDSQRAV